MPELLTERDRAQLLANGRSAARDRDFDPEPVVKLFTPDASAVWLLSELDPDEQDLAYGLCDLGLGTPEMGDVRLSDLGSLRGALRLRVERDLAFRARYPISEYARLATRLGYIDA